MLIFPNTCKTDPPNWFVCKTTLEPDRSIMNPFRRNISIGILLDLSIPMEMTSIGPLVENEKSSKTPNNYVISFLTQRT